MDEPTEQAEAEAEARAWLAQMEDPDGPMAQMPCFHCHQRKPRDQFIRGNKSGKWLCTECWSSRHRRRKERRRNRDRSQKLQAGIKRIVSAAIAQDTRVPEITEVCSEMYKVFGGMQEFVRSWKNQIDLAADGSKTKLDQFYAIFKMTAQAAAEQKKYANFEEMSDEELEKVIQDFTLRLFVPQAEGEQQVATG